MLICMGLSVYSPELFFCWWWGCPVVFAFGYRKWHWPLWTLSPHPPPHTNQIIRRRIHDADYMPLELLAAALVILINVAQRIESKRRGRSERHFKSDIHDMIRWNKQPATASIQRRRFLPGCSRVSWMSIAPISFFFASFYPTFTSPTPDTSLI